MHRWLYFKMNITHKKILSKRLRIHCPIHLSDCVWEVNVSQRNQLKKNILVKTDFLKKIGFHETIQWKTAPPPQAHDYNIEKDQIIFFIYILNLSCVAFSEFLSIFSLNKKKILSILFFRKKKSQNVTSDVGWKWRFVLVCVWQQRTFKWQR